MTSRNFKIETFTQLLDKEKANFKIILKRNEAIIANNEKLLKLISPNNFNVKKYVMLENKIKEYRSPVERQNVGAHRQRRKDFV